MKVPSEEREEPDMVSGWDVMVRGLVVDGKVPDERSMVFREEDEEEEK